MRKRCLILLIATLGLCVLPSRAVVDVMEADLLCAYSPDAASRSGGEPNIQVNLANTVAGANVIQANSGTGVRWHIAGYFMSSANPISTDNNATLSLLNSDASFADVRNYAVTLGADEVNYHAYTTGAAGNAYQPGNYAVMGVQWMWYIVFAHEVGHNYGANHADGLGFDASAAPYRTVMLHNYCGGTSLPYYTNPNLYYLGVELQGTTLTSCGQGNPIYNGNNGGRVGSYGPTMSGTRQRTVVGPNLTNVLYHWQFTNAPGAALAGTTITDSVSSAVAIVRGVGATFTGEGLRIPGGTLGNTAADSIAAYIDLPNHIISAQTNLTIEIWATPLSGQYNGRVCSFGKAAEAGDGLGESGEYTGAPGTPAPGNTTPTDEFMLSFVVGTDLGQQRFKALATSGGNYSIISAMPTLAGARQFYTITFEDGAGSYGSSGGRVTWYRNGDPVTYLDVNFHLSNLNDVNNWLGRSIWGVDGLANADYAEVRISNVALTRQQVQANYRLGPNPAANSVTLTAHDALGSTSFNAVGNWSSNAAPTLAQDYDTSYFSLRTPATSSAYVFQGNSLKLSSGGALLWKGTASSSITVTNLIFDGGMVQHAGSGTFTLAGNVNVSTNGGTFYGVNGGINLTAGLVGNGPVTYLANATTLANNNPAFTGKHLVGAGGSGILAIDSEARLGPMPATLVPDCITLDNGTLQTTTTFAFTNSNRGITLSYNGGIFSPNVGTTLTISDNLTGIGNFTKAGYGTVILTGSNSFTGPLDVDTSSSSANDGILRIASPHGVPSAVPYVQIFNNNTGVSTLQLDGSDGNITLTKPFFVNCRNNAVATIQNLGGTNTLSGTIFLSTGGNLFNLRSDAGLLVLSGPNRYVGSLTGGRTYSFTGSGDFLVSGAIFDSTNGAPISLSKSGTGRLTLAGANTYGSSTVISGGALLVNGSTGAGAISVANATLGGNGTINGQVTMQSSGTMSPGTSIGKLTCNNNVTLGGTTLMEISKSPLTNDSLQVSGTLTYAGTLTVSNLAGTLQAGDSFALFKAANYNSSFTATNLPSLGENLAWVFNSTNGTLSVVQPIATNSTNLVWEVGGTNLTLSWPADHIGWRLEMQTNSLAEGIGTNWNTVLGASDTNRIVVPIDVFPGSIFFRLTYP